MASLPRETHPVKTVGNISAPVVQARRLSVGKTRGIDFDTGQSVSRQQLHKRRRSKQSVCFAAVTDEPKAILLFLRRRRRARKRVESPPAEAASVTETSREKTASASISISGGASTTARPCSARTRPADCQSAAPLSPQRSARIARPAHVAQPPPPRHQ